MIPLFTVGHEPVQLSLGCSALLQELENGNLAAAQYWGELEPHHRLAVVQRAETLPDVVRRLRLQLRHLIQPTPAETELWERLPADKRMPLLPKPRHHQAAVGHAIAASTVRQLPLEGTTTHRSLVQKVSMHVE